MKTLLEQAFRTPSRSPAPPPSRRGFILIAIVGMRVILVVLGLSFAEQGRVDLLGASNSRDLSAVESLAEHGFETSNGLVCRFAEHLVSAFCFRQHDYLFSWGLVSSVMKSREWRLSTGGYLGHIAELYCSWTWIPAFFAASLSAQTGSCLAATSAKASMLAFGVIAVGGIGCVWGGVADDRIGREWLVTCAMAASGMCALLIGLTFGRSLWLRVPVALVCGFFMIADSAQFSVLVTENVPAHAVGTALTVQTSLGFL